MMMATRPQTLYGIADSPVGLAAWMIDQMTQTAAGLSRPASSTGQRAHGQLTRDEILDNITLYWLTNTGVSASRLYWEYKGVLRRQGRLHPGRRERISRRAIYEAPRSWTERAYPKLIHYNKVDKGGHFAAWEQPGLFTAELRAGFRPLRELI